MSVAFPELSSAFSVCIPIKCACEAVWANRLFLRAVRACSVRVAVAVFEHKFPCCASVALSG